MQKNNNIHFIMAIIVWTLSALLVSCLPAEETEQSTKNNSSEKSYADKFREKAESQEAERNGHNGSGTIDPDVRKANLAKLKKRTTNELKKGCHKFKDAMGRESPYRFVNELVNWYTANDRPTPSGGNSKKGGTATCASACGKSWRIFSEDEVEALVDPIDVIIGGKEIMQSDNGMNSWSSSTGFGLQEEDDDIVDAAVAFRLRDYGDKIVSANADALNYLLCRKD